MVVCHASHPVPARLQREIATWQVLLARSIAAHHPSATVHDLTLAVQTTIARLLLFCVCAARSTPTGHPREWLPAAEIAARLCQFFPPAPSDLLVGTIADEPLGQIIARISASDKVAMFQDLTATGLRQLYAQLPGTSIQVAADGAVRVEPQTAARRACGQYFTPPALVDYLVKQTLDPLLAGSPDMSTLRILDPACGAGAFLLGVYQYLLDYYREHYSRTPEQQPDCIYRGADGRWHLKLTERMRILQTHLYGVDIDPLAVEVTRLALLGMLLEDVAELPGPAWGFPPLPTTIICGHALIGPDFVPRQQPSAADADALPPVQPFDWDAQFPEVLTGALPGFAAVIGNPPWGGAIDHYLDYFHAHYPASTQDHTDSFKLFIDMGFRLVRRGGLVGMIVPNTLLWQDRNRDVRRLLLRQQILLLLDLGAHLFSGVSLPACFFLACAASPTPDHAVPMRNLAHIPPAERMAALTTTGTAQIVSQAAFQSNPNQEFAPPARGCAAPVIPLGAWPGLTCLDAGINYQRVRVGMQAKGQGDLSRRLFYTGPQQHPDDTMYWKGADIGRYRMTGQTERYCRSHYRDLLRPGEIVCLNPPVYAVAPKILVRQTADRIIATIDPVGVWFGRSLIAIVPTGPSPYRLEYLLGLLNSRYIAALYQELAHEAGRVFAQVKLSRLRQLLLRPLDFTDASDTAYHDRLVALVERMLALNQQVPAATTDQERNELQRQIACTDNAIDALVDELYGICTAGQTIPLSVTQM